MSLIIGLTGGIATGKSTVSNYLRKKGHPVVCADELAHYLQSPKQPAYYEIIEYFGTRILNKDQSINRIELGKKIFSDEQSRLKLNQILHPKIEEEIKNKIAHYYSQKIDLIFLDIPLLFEVGFDQLCDHTVCVYSSRDNQISRIRSRDQLTSTQINLRLASQMDIEKKCQLADYTIDNQTTIDELHLKVDHLIETLLDKNPNKTSIKSD